MALSYQTEYRLGKRGRISRSYTGFAAFVAILFDLVFGLVFELVTSVVVLALRLVVLALRVVVVCLDPFVEHSGRRMAAIVAVVTLPFAMLHHSVNRLRSRIESGRRDFRTGSPAKPDWALAREV